MKLAGKSFTVIGVAKTPLGGQSSDIYIKLAQLQKLSGREARVNTIYVRADSASDVLAVSAEIERSVSGASVTTASDLAERVSGTLVDAKNLAGKLGSALSIVALLSAFLIATLLTLSSVSKRIRELGTLKSLGWSQWLVVRQVTGESLFQGVLGGAVGVLISSPERQRSPLWRRHSRRRSPPRTRASDFLCRSDRGRSRVRRRVSRWVHR